MVKNKLTFKELRRAFVDTLPVLAGYIVLGIGFGVILRSRGYGAVWAFCMSFFIFAGSMQYVAIDLLTGGAGLIATALTTLAVNARHLFYSLSMVEKYKGKHPILAFTLTDETYSLVCGTIPGETEPEQNRYCLLVSLMNYGYWVTGSVIGSLLGSVIPFSTEGIDFAMTALFLTVFVEQWLSTKNHISAIVGILCSVLCLILFGSDGFLIPAMIAIALALTLLRKKEGITNE